MMGHCDNCGNEETRYGTPDVMNTACRVCGSFIFWCLHIGFAGSPSHWVKINLQTHEVLSHDFCDDIRTKK